MLELNVTAGAVVAVVANFVVVIDQIDFRREGAPKFDKTAERSKTFVQRRTPSQ